MPVQQFYPRASEGEGSQTIIHCNDASKMILGIGESEPNVSSAAMDDFLFFQQIRINKSNWKRTLIVLLEARKCAASRQFGDWSIRKDLLAPRYQYGIRHRQSFARSPSGVPSLSIERTESVDVDVFRHNVDFM